MIKLKYSEILKLNKELGDSIKSSSYKITILSNIIVHQIKELLEYRLRKEGLNADVELGDYNNIVQDSDKYKNSHAVVIFWELCNIIDGFQYKVNLLNDNQLDEILNKSKAEIDLVLKNFEKTSLVLINKFTSLSFYSLKIKKNNYEKLATQLNEYMEEKITSNVRLVDIDKAIASVGILNSIDLRYYYSSKSLYKVDFFKVYIELINPFFMSTNGKAKKALIFDCDNTLWKGVLGEDGFEKIEMSTRTEHGAIYTEIQSIALALNNQGVLIGLCSKNNSKDVDEVIRSHPDMQLRNEHITINKSNWSDKVTNLKEISEELNIGLESLVFVDDSDFEVNLVREKLPEVTVLQVPERIYEYPGLLRKKMDLFYNFSLTLEDKKKIEMYRQQVKRDKIKKKFINIEDYIASLELKMAIFEDDESIVPRMSQMTQKTNQFNLSTKRYTEGDIQNLIDDLDSVVYAFSVSDKFGDNGVTGLCIVSGTSKGETAEIDSLLMSCRIIGRNIEYAFMDHVIEKMKDKGLSVIKAKYVKTRKNEQVKNFYDKCSFELIDQNEIIRDYILNTKSYKPKKLNYIEVISE